MTFQVGQRLYAASADGQAVRCLLEIPEDEASALLPPSLGWGDAADRLIVGDHAYLASGEFTTGFPALSTLRWTKPTGTSVLAIEGDRLVKRSIATGVAKDVTFLARHDLAIYHPAGVEILSVGESAAGDYGIFVASNTGTNVRQIVDGTGATVTELGFRYDGGPLLFIAVHDDGSSHLHERSLRLPDDVVRQEDDSFELYKTSAVLHGLQVSPWESWWAVNEACAVDQDPRVVPEGGLTMPAELDGVAAEAVGWLPGYRLAIMTFPQGCDQPGDLWLVDFSLEEGGRSTATLLYSGSEEAAATGLDIQMVGVANAATRSPAPEPPPPIGDINREVEA